MADSDKRLYAIFASGRVDKKTYQGRAYKAPNLSSLCAYGIDDDNYARVAAQHKGTTHALIGFRVSASALDGTCSKNAIRRLNTKMIRVKVADLAAGTVQRRGTVFQVQGGLREAAQLATQKSLFQTTGEDGDSSTGFVRMSLNKDVETTFGNLMDAFVKALGGDTAPGHVYNYDAAPSTRKAKKKGGVSAAQYSELLGKLNALSTRQVVSSIVEVAEDSHLHVLIGGLEKFRKEHGALLHTLHEIHIRDVQALETRFAEFDKTVKGLVASQHKPEANSVVNLVNPKGEKKLVALIKHVIAKTYEPRESRIPKNETSVSGGSGETLSDIHAQPLPKREKKNPPKVPPAGTTASALSLFAATGGGGVGGGFGAGYNEYEF